MDILGLRVSEISPEEVLNTVSGWVKGRDQHQIVSVNPEGIVLVQKDARYREVVNRAALALADGMGIVLAGVILPKKFKVQSSKFKLDRITGVDLMVKLCELAATNGWRVHLVGGVGETAKVAAEKLREKFPGMMVIGEEGFPFNRHSRANGNPEKKTKNNNMFKFVSGSPISVGDDNDSENKLISRINECQPQFLFVALGQPRQELWIDEHLSKMPSVRVAMGVGGAFDFISGLVPRAPLIMRKMGLEWLWRLIVQPWRFPRICNATVRFMWLVVKERLKR